MFTDTCKCGSSAESHHSTDGPYSCTTGHNFWVCSECTYRHNSRAAWSMCCLESE